GTMGVQTIKLTEKKGGLAGALIVREHQELVFISREGMVQRTGVRGISRYGRASQGVRVMNLREGDAVSAVALVVESTDTAAQVRAAAEEEEPVEGEPAMEEPVADEDERDEPEAPDA
ncbi:MAG: DNA gyrase C-terminal beta-propeller domain-containing protein, partial [Thermoleophilaceae bacterium]